MVDMQAQVASTYGYFFTVYKNMLKCLNFIYTEETTVREHNIDFS